MARDSPYPDAYQDGHTAATTTAARKQPANMSAKNKPWRETPLIESANLSKAAGWYGCTALPIIRKRIYKIHG